MSIAPEEIQRLIERLPRQNPVRRLAQAIVEGKLVPLDCIQPVAISLTDPAGKSWRENLVAVWAAARAASSTDRHAAAGWLSHVLERWPSLDRWPRLRRSYLRTLGLLYLPALAGLIEAGGAGIGLIFVPPFAAIPFCLLVYPFSARLDRNRMNRIRAQAADGLGLLTIPHSAASLAAAAFDHDRRVREACRSALIQVLPTLTEERYGQLPFDTTPRLCALLANDDEAIVLATLKALRCVGDSRAFRPVERLARGSWSTRESPAVLAESEQALMILRARQKRENEAASLLRPTGSPLAPQESLLRSYSESGVAPSENLLRAAASDSGEN